MSRCGKLPNARRSQRPMWLWRFSTNRNSEMARAFSPRTLTKRWLCSEHHIRNLVVSGELPGWRAGGKLRISREDVEAYERRSASTEPNEERH